MTADDLFVCPVCRGRLQRRDGTLVCSGCGCRYPVHDGVPFLYPTGAIDPTGGAGRWRRAYHSILASPRVYDLAQRYGGGVPIGAEVAKALADAGGATVLDVGAGTGMVGEALPAGATYIWLDNDPLKLAGFRRKRPDAIAVLADAARLPFADRSVGVVTIADVSHHLPDASLRQFLTEAARVVRDRLVLTDALRTPRRRSRALWMLDLGRFPRTQAELEFVLSESFEVTGTVEFRVHHDHVVFDARPRRPA